MTYYYMQDDLFFFFQAEDGIRDLIVTGVQTCALPIPVTSRRRHTRSDRDWDRKSTRRNSSHDQISYPVFCLDLKSVVYGKSEDIGRRRMIKKQNIPNVDDIIYFADLKQRLTGRQTQVR